MKVRSETRLEITEDGRGLVYTSTTYIDSPPHVTRIELTPLSEDEYAVVETLNQESPHQIGRGSLLTAFQHFNACIDPSLDALWCYTELEFNRRRSEP